MLHKAKINGLITSTHVNVSTVTAKAINRYGYHKLAKIGKTLQTLE